MLLYDDPVMTGQFDLPTYTQYSRIFVHSKIEVIKCFLENLKNDTNSECIIGKVNLNVEEVVPRFCLLYTSDAADE